MVRGSILGMCHVFNLKSFQIISSAEYLLFVVFFCCHLCFRRTVLNQSD